MPGLSAQVFWEKRGQLTSPNQQTKGEARPITFLIALWWGYLLAAMYILYGGVSIVLAFLDRNFRDIWSQVLFVAVGILVLVFAYDFRDRKMFGWYGLLVVNCAVLLLSIFTLKFYGAPIILLLALVGLAALFVPSTREYLGSRS